MSANSINTPVSLSVLLIEDDHDHAELIKRFTRSSAPTLVWCKSAQEALDHLVRKPVDRVLLPKVILLDLRMPGMDGLTLLEELKAGKEAQKRGVHLVPVVVLTSSDNDKDRSKAYDKYVNSYLVKPGTHEEWSNLLREVDQYWLQLNQTA